AGEDEILRRIARLASPGVGTFAALYLAQLSGETMSGDPLEWPLFADDDSEHTLKLAFIEALAAHPTPDTPRLLLRFARLPALAGAATGRLRGPPPAES